MIWWCTETNFVGPPKYTLASSNYNKHVKRVPLNWFGHSLPFVTILVARKYYLPGPYIFIYTERKKHTSRKIQRWYYSDLETSWMCETSLHNYLSLQSCDCATPGDVSLSLFRDNPLKILWSRLYHFFTRKRSFSMFVQMFCLHDSYRAMYI